MMVKNNLIGGIPTPLKNMSSSDWVIIPTIGGNQSCSKSPASCQWANSGYVYKFPVSIKIYVSRTMDKSKKSCLYNHRCRC